MEICVDSVASAVAAERGGADRVELCSNLLEGGVTPSAGLIAEVRQRISIALHVMIRPHPGNFCYGTEDLAVMGRDIEAAKRLRADGVVLGVLRPDAEVDVEQTKNFVDLARPLSVTFHRAFDVSMDLSRALEAVCATGADRILTSGGAVSSEQGVKALSQLVYKAGDRVTIMAGGGVRAYNAAEIVGATNVQEIHSGLSVPVDEASYLRRGVTVGKAHGPEWRRTQVRQEDVRELCDAVKLEKLSTGSS